MVGISFRQRHSLCSGRKLNILSGSFGVFCYQLVDSTVFCSRFVGIDHTVTSWRVERLTHNGLHCDVVFGVKGQLCNFHHRRLSVLINLLMVE